MLATRSPVLVEVELGQVDLRVRTLLRHDGARVSLTPTEADLLGHLAAAGGADVSRGELLREVWGYREGVRTRTIDTTVRRLRAKIERVPGQPRHLQTVKGVGYRFAPLLGGGEEEALVGADLDAFVGRDEELAVLDARDEAGDRLVTLWGPGGVGKTRLARRWLRGRHALAVDLSTAATVEDAEAALCGAAGLRRQPVGALATALERRGVRWVLLDDLHHLLPAGARLARALAADDLRVLVTSRQRLAVDGEVPVAVGPLPRDAAVALLRARAPTALADHADAELHPLVERLGGIPLPLELAARRAELLGVPELLGRLDAGLELLDAGGASVVDRLGWSWEALGPDERDALQALAALPDDLPLDLAEATIGGDRALDRIQALRDRGWLGVQRRVGGRRRVALLAPLRELVRARTAAAPEATVAARLRAARHLAALDTAEARARQERGDARHRAALEAERWNLLAAARTAAARGEVEIAAACALAAHEAGRFVAAAPGVGELLATLAEDDALPPALRARLRLARAGAWRRTGERERALVAARAVRADAATPAAQREEATLLAGVLLLEGGALDEAEVLLREACAAESPRVGDLARLDLGNALLTAGRLDEAAGLLAEAVARARRRGARRLAALALANLAAVHHERGELDAAEEGYREALSLHRALGNRRDVALVETNRGLLALDRGDATAACEHLRLARRAHRQQGQVRGEALSCIALGEAERRRGRSGGALARALEGRALAEEHGDRVMAAAGTALVAELVHPPDLPAVEEAVAALRARGAVVDAAVADCRRGRILAGYGRLDEARACLDAARQLQDARGIGACSDLGRHVDALAGVLADHLRAGGEPATVRA